MTEVGLLGPLGNTLEQGPVSKRMAPELDQAGQQIPAPAGCSLNILILNLQLTGCAVPIFQLDLQLEGDCHPTS